MAEVENSPPSRGTPTPSFLAIGIGALALLGLMGLLPVFGYLVANIVSYDYTLLDRNVAAPQLADFQTKPVQKEDKPNLPTDLDRLTQVEPPENFNALDRAQWKSIRAFAEAGLPRAINLEEPSPGTGHTYRLVLPVPGVREGAEVPDLASAIPGIRAVIEALQLEGIEATALDVEAPQKDGSTLVWTITREAMAQIDGLTDADFVQASKTESALIKVRRDRPSATDTKHLKYSKWYWGRGVQFAKKKDKENALDQFRRAYFFTKWPDFARSLGIAHAEMGKQDEAATLYAKALEGNPYDAGLLNAYLLFLNRNGRHNEVIKLTDQWQRRPGWNEAERAALLYHRGFALGRTREFELSERTLRAYLEIRPKEAFASYLLGVAINAQERPHAALPFLRRAVVEAAPGNTEQQLALARALVEAGLLQEAVESYEAYRNQLVDSNRPPMDFFLDLGNCYLALNEIQDAAGVVSEGIRLYGALRDLVALQEKIRKASAGNRS